MKVMQRVYYTAMGWLICGLLVVVPLPAHAEDTAYVGNATGGLRIGLVTEATTITLVDEPRLLKGMLDAGWHEVRGRWQTQVVETINSMSSSAGVTVESDLASAERTELQVMKVAQGVALKFVLHDNKMRVTVKTPWSFITLKYDAQFEIAVGLVLKLVSPPQRLKVENATLALENVKVNGDGWMSDLVEAALQAGLDALTDGATHPHMLEDALVQAINAQLAALGSAFGRIPSDAVYFDSDVDPMNGRLSLCFKFAQTEQCKFSR